MARRTFTQLFNSMQIPTTSHQVCETAAVALMQRNYGDVVVTVVKN